MSILVVVNVVLVWGAAKAIWLGAADAADLLLGAWLVAALNGIIWTIKSDGEAGRREAIANKR